jgi:hypothetical protein
LHPIAALDLPPEDILVWSVCENISLSSLDVFGIDYMPAACESTGLSSSACHLAQPSVFATIF